jgi:hypothetical protein
VPRRRFNSGRPLQKTPSTCFVFSRNEVGSALWAAHLIEADTLDLTRLNLVAAMCAEGKEGGFNFFEIDLPAGRHGCILSHWHRGRSDRITACPAKTTRSPNAIGPANMFRGRANTATTYPARLRNKKWCGLIGCIGHESPVPKRGVCVGTGHTGSCCLLKASLKGVWCVGNC